MFKFRIFIITFVLFTSAVFAQYSNVYKFAREFNLAQVTNQAPSPELNDLLRDKRAIDERYVGPFEIEPYSINVTEYDLMTVYTNTDIDAWHSCTSMANQGYGRNWSTSQISDVSRYIICTRSNSQGKFASLWFLQNDVGFQVSTQDYYVAQNGITSKIASVAVGTFGDYCPREYVHEIWPPLPQRPDGNTQTQLMCNVSHDAYYRLALSGNIAVNDEDADGDEVPGFADFDGEDMEFKVWDIRIPEYLQSSSTMFRFEYDASHPEDVYLDQSDGTYKIANNNSLRLWTKDARQERIPLAVDLKGDYVGPGEYSYTELVHGQEVLSLYIEGVAPAQGEIKLSYLLEGESRWACFDAVDFGVFNPCLIPDWNHDRIINSLDEGKATASNPYRFWINNDDDESGDAKTGTDNDIPGDSVSDAGDSDVDGLRDLIDFCPVYVDLKSTLDLLGTEEYSYILDYDGDGTVGVIYTELTPGTAGNYLVDTDTANDIAEETVYQITSMQGGHITLPLTFLQNIQSNGMGIILVEFSAVGTEPLQLEILNAQDEVLYSEYLNLSVSGIGGFYRWINTRSAVINGTVIDPTNTDPPTNYPDSLCGDKSFVFVHGYSVNEEQARGWHSEVFKRMYWSGSDAKYYGVTWFGNESQYATWLPILGGKTPDYHVNVIHALDTASNLTEQITESITGDYIIAAHSLGNMVVSAAIQDYGLSPQKYLMVDAAVAIEAYDSAADHSLDMVHSEWGTYTNQTRLWCSEWHELFTNTDYRSSLTWRGRFSDVVDVAYNFYSSGEEVLAMHDHVNSPGLLDVGMFGNEGEFSWALQEKLKGRMWVSGIGGSTYGGWGFYDNGVYDGVDMTNVSNGALKTEPFFKSGSGDVEDMYSTNTVIASDFADENHEYLLAGFIPSRTLPAGANEVDAILSSRNLNMQFVVGESAGYQNDWPAGRTSGNWGSRWLHSDLKSLAYPHVYLLFDEFVEKVNSGE